MIEVGDIIHGFCGGFLGRDAYSPSTVIGVGRDWVVVRQNGEPVLATDDSTHGSIHDCIERYADYIEKGGAL